MEKEYYIIQMEKLNMKEILLMINLLETHLKIINPSLNK